MSIVSAVSRLERLGAEKSMMMMKLRSDIDELGSFLSRILFIESEGHRTEELVMGWSIEYYPAALITHEGFKFVKRIGERLIWLSNGQKSRADLLTFSEDLANGFIPKLCTKLNAELERYRHRKNQIEGWVLIEQWRAYSFDSMERLVPYLLENIPSFQVLRGQGAMEKWLEQLFREQGDPAIPQLPAVDLKSLEARVNMAIFLLRSQHSIRTPLRIEDNIQEVISILDGTKQLPDSVHTVS